MPSIIQLEGLQTEGRNSESNKIDQVSTLELCQIINNEDATVAGAVQKCLPIISQAIDGLTESVRKGGRVVYVGAGTSGRLGVLDASEIPPTFSASSEQFVSLIAGGDIALRYAQEGAEDDVMGAEEDLKALNLDPALDCLIGIAASGRTPYVLSCLSYAKSLGLKTVGVACCLPSAMATSGNVDYMISVVTGPEVVTGSTRMKAGTATKLVLNTLSTGLMIKTGKTYGNMMIDLKSSNKKLQQRSRNIIRTICGSSCPTSDEDLDKIISDCNGSVKVAVATILLQATADDAAKRLEINHGVLSAVLKNSAIGGISSTKVDSNPDGPFVLSVDGGGSKCAAMLLGKDGQEGRGEAGECNASSVGVEAAISSVSLAIQRAVDSCPATKGRPIQSINFKSIWVGLAGYDRPEVARNVDAALTKLFNCPKGEGLKISTDIELLVTPFANQHHLDSAVILVAGTGSIAMSYKRDGDRFVRTGRAGGWGHLLGDDGSGYGIGREGLRVALETADELPVRPTDSQITGETNGQTNGYTNGETNSEVNGQLDGQVNGETNGETAEVVDYLAEKIFEHFRLNEPGQQAYLLDRILAREIDDKQQASTTATRRIADVARVVIDASPHSDRARAILVSGSKSLVRILTTLVKRQRVDASKSSLILAGGLMQNKTYNQMLLEELSTIGQKFDSVQAVSHPALDAAQYLLEQA